MNKRPILIRLFSILFGLGLGLGLVAVLKSSRDSENPISRPYSTPVRNQVTKFIYHQSPFYFPFKARTTQMHIPAPFSEVFEFGARHNSHGFRTQEYTIAHPPNTFRIVVLGDSITWGQGVKQEETFPQVLRMMLQRKCPEIHFELIGLGVCGHRLADNLIKLLVHTTDLKPDLVLIQVCVNDLDFYDYVSISHFQKIAGKDAISPVDKQREIWQEGSLDWKVFSECLNAIRSWSDTNSVPVGFVFFPMVDAGKEGRNFRHYDVETFPWLNDFQKVFQEVRSRNFAAVFLMDKYREAAGERYLAVSRSDGHPNAYAHYLAAEGITPFLFQENLVNCSRSKLRKADPEWKEESKLRAQADKEWLQFNTSYKKQLKLFQKLKELYPKNPWITMELGIVYQGLARWNEAFETYFSMVELAPSFVAPWYHMSLCIEDITQKKNLLKKMIQVLPDHNFALQDLANLYLKDRQTKEACGLLQHLMEIPQSQEIFDKSKALYEKNGCSERR